MTKITSTGKQFVITIPKDIVMKMGWSKKTEILVSKHPDKDIVYIEEIKKKK
jgi:hypothetical protein